MPETRTFQANGQTVKLTANSAAPTLLIEIGNYKYEDPDKFLHLHLSTFQALYPQLKQSLTGATDLWRQSLMPALGTLESGYAATLLGGTLGARDPYVLGANPMKVVEAITQKRLQTWSFSTNSLAAVSANLLAVDTATAGIQKALASAKLHSDRALDKKAGARITAMGIVDNKAEEIADLERQLQTAKDELGKTLRELERVSAGKLWSLTTKNTTQAIGKTFNVRIKQGKFRQLVFFSQFRHSIPYFLEGQYSDAGALLGGPPSKYLNTLTILTAGQLETAFVDFVRDTYVPYLNLGDKSLRKFEQVYQPQGGDPMFHAEKYYGDQGMHCTPVATPGVAFTLTQQDHALFYTMLPYIRDPNSSFSAADANDIAAGLRRTMENRNSEFANLISSYKKSGEILQALYNRGQRQLENKPNANIREAIGNLQNAIKNFAPAFSLNLKL